MVDTRIFYREHSKLIDLLFFIGLLCSMGHNRFFVWQKRIHQFTTKFKQSYCKLLLSMPDFIRRLAEIYCISNYPSLKKKMDLTFDTICHEQIYMDPSRQRQIEELIQRCLIEDAREKGLKNELDLVKQYVDWAHSLPGLIMSS
jgi:hypothetical protein